MSRLLFTLACCCAVAFAADKKPQPPENGVASDINVSIKATVYPDAASVREVLGDSLGGHYIVINIDLSPNKKFTIDHDNFLLRTDKDGEKSHAYEPTQIAGGGTLVVTTTDDADRKKGGTSGVTFGGMSSGMGGSPGMVGSPKPVGVKMKEADGDQSNLLKTLQSKILPQKEVEEPTSGLLYFPMEKQKVKDLELIVTTPSGKLHIRFTK